MAEVRSEAGFVIRVSESVHRLIKACSYQLRRAWAYTVFAIRFLVNRSDGPFFLGLVPNDTCNLNCINCRVANTEQLCMTFEDIRGVFERHYKAGVRFLTLSGGEPYLWRDGRRKLRDIVELAREIGYVHISVFTNGTIPMDAPVDYTLVSIDGVGETFRKIRGVNPERVLRNLRNLRSRHAIVYTINTLNYREIRPFLDSMQVESPRTPIIFFFHTPYYGKDDLYLSQAQRSEAVQTLIACKSDGLPVVNSAASLKAYLSGNPALPASFCRIVDLHGEYKCCRVNRDPDICKDCGYTVTSELALARKGSIGAILAMAKVS